jgi:hypothetical protein
MQVREYGNFLRINLSEVLTGSIVTMELYAPNSSTPIVITTSGGLSIGALDLEVKGKTYAAFEYLQYQIQQGVINVKGLWSVAATVADSGGNILRITKKLKFAVTG